MERGPSNRIGSRGLGSALASLCALLVLAGCAAKQANRADLIQEQRGQYEFDKEGRIPPLSEDAVRRQVDRVDTFEEMAVESGDLAVESVEILEEPIEKPAADPKTKTALGYRVQLFASGTMDTAEDVKRAAELRLGEPVYIEIESGIFKVRVGNCMTRGAADTLLAKCRDAGYQDAWIANTRVLLSAPK